MNVLQILFNGLYRAAEGSPSMQQMVVGAAQAYNDRMAEINRQPSVPATCEVRQRARMMPDRRGITGRTYFERGKPVRILVQWAGKGPRNVAIERADGTRVVRPFRGLRRKVNA